jgi:hypothetical protein
LMHVVHVFVTSGAKAMMVQANAILHKSLVLVLRITTTNTECRTATDVVNEIGTFEYFRHPEERQQLLIEIATQFPIAYGNVRVRDAININHVRLPFNIRKRTLAWSVRLRDSRAIGNMLCADDCRQRKEYKI